MGRYNRSNSITKTAKNHPESPAGILFGSPGSLSCVQHSKCVGLRTSRLLFTGLEEMWYDKACAGIGEACRILTAAFDGRQNCRVPAVLV